MDNNSIKKLETDLWEAADLFRQGSSNICSSTEEQKRAISENCFGTNFQIRCPTVRRTAGLIQF